LVSNQNSGGRKEMLTMPEINSIKFMRNDKSLSVNSIANILNINWRTAKKYADHDQLPKETSKPRKGMMYDDQWGEILTDWLWEDQKLKKKSRRTNTKMFRELKEMGFPGSYRTICNFAKEWREGRQAEEETQDKNSERLDHPPAEAQLDFGLMEVVKDGNYMDVHCLVMTLPFSNAAFVTPLPGENQECVLYGLKRIFGQLGGVPQKIRIDNFKAAVVKPRKNGVEAEFTSEFIQFAGYYGFTPQACNPYAGHEKGNVENKVGYIRYNFINPAPVIKDLSHLTDLLEKNLIEDRNREHYDKKRSIKDLLEEEHTFLLVLSDEEYPVFKEDKAKANKYGEITIDGTKVYVPKGYNYTQLTVIKYWDRFKVLSPYGEILFEDFRPYMNRNRKIPWVSILKSWLVKPRVVNYSRFTPYLPGRIAEYLKVTDYRIRKERIQWLISLLLTHEMKEINECFYDLVNEQPEALREPTHHPYDIDWNKYDQLQSTTSEGEE
jgi:transposase